MIYSYEDYFAMSSFVLSENESNAFIDKDRQDKYFKIIWADKTITIGIDSYPIRLQKNQLLFCTPLNQLDSGFNFEQTVSYLFNKEFYCVQEHDNDVSCNGLLFFGSTIPMIITLDNTQIKHFKSLQSIFKEEFRTKDRNQGEMLEILLKQLLIRSIRIARKELPQAKSPQTTLPMIQQYSLLVEKHFKEKHKVSEYAEILNITPKSLSNLFLKYPDKTPLLLINSRIVLEAQRLLKYTDKTCKEISVELGFSEASHFSKFFKKNSGIPPNAYRSTIR